MSAQKTKFSPGDMIGISQWFTINQEMITGFGVSTLDPDPVHMDPQWAAENSPYGETISFGFLTVSLLSRLLYSATHHEPTKDMDMDAGFMNYGFDRLRLMSPVPVDSKVRGVFKVKDAQTTDTGHERLVIDAAIEIEGSDKPALVGDWVLIYVTH